MKQTTQHTCNTTQTTPDTTPLLHNTNNTYHPCTYINEIYSDRSISRGAAHVLIRLVTASGYHGYCYPSVATLCQWTGYKQTQLRHYLRQLVQLGHIRIIHIPGRSNEYQLTRIIPKSSRPLRYSAPIKRFIKRKRITDQENVISLHRPEQPQTPDPGPPQTEHTAPALVQTDHHQAQEQNQVDDSHLETQTSKPPVNHYLLSQIMQLTGDKKSFPFWFKVVKRVDEQTIYSALSSLRIANDCNQVQHRGRYLVGILKQLAPELFQEQTQTRPHVQAIGPDQEETTPTVERNQQLNMEQIRNIRALLNSKTPPPTRPKTHMSRIMHQDALNRLKFQSYGPGKVSVGGKGEVVQIGVNSLTLDVSGKIPLVSPTSRARTHEILYDCTDQIPPPPRGEQ